MPDVGKGTPVIFVGPEGLFLSGLTIDALYFVDEVDECGNGKDCPSCGGTLISLRGGSGFWYWYALYAFRPLGGEPTKEELEIETPWDRIKEDA
jgi:hypothetical protein